MKCRTGNVSNSSSSSFIINGKTTGEVLRVVEKIIDLHNEISGDKPLSFSDMFGGIKVAEGKELEEIVEMSRHYTYAPGRGAWEGAVVIDSARDNSIPCGVMDMIEEYLDAERVHWG